jgi:hypothetical protein
VCTGEVVQERGCRADKATCVAGAVARRVLARLAVAMLVIVGRPDCAAVDDIWAWEADGLHQLLHGIAPAVATSGHATHMALAIASDLELVTTHRTKQCALLCTAYRHICQHVH